MAKKKAEAQIILPGKLAEIFSIPRGEVRYRGAYGGRGSGKSFSFAKMSAVFGYKESLRILCTRDLETSIKESFYAEVKNAIVTTPWLNSVYTIGESYIKNRLNGTEYIFRGLRHNIASIKSMGQIDICIVEEAEDVPEKSWIDLVPTIRADKSEIWPIWNPRTEGSPVDKRFRKNVDREMAIAEINYIDNRFFPGVLERERLRDQKNCDPAVYSHIWDGAYLAMSNEQVLYGKWRVDSFEPLDHWNGPYYGSDWGFSTDPTTLVKLWIADGCLFVQEEAWEVGCELDHTPALFDKVEGSRTHLIRADNARPETISHMRRRGFNIRAAKKGPGSVEEGVVHLRSFEWIVIHPRCKNAINEAKNWKYKVDKLSGDILPIIIDKDNHIWDAARYALEPIMKKGDGRGTIDTESTENNDW
jgi:phage terminase large subunit